MIVIIISEVQWLSFIITFHHSQFLSFTFHWLIIFNPVWLSYFPLPFFMSWLPISVWWCWTLITSIHWVLKKIMEVFLVFLCHFIKWFILINMLKNEDTFYQPPLESRSRARTLSLSYFPKLSNDSNILYKKGRLLNFEDPLSWYLF